MLWTYAASRQLQNGADLMYTDEPREGGTQIETSYRANKHKS
jgi:hypothetical protein